MKVLMPAKLTPLPKSTAANGMLPIEPMKVKNAASGPTRLCSRTSQTAAQL